MTIQVGIFGISGRIGQEIAQQVLNSSTHTLSSGAVRENHAWAGQDMGLHFSGQATNAAFSSDLQTVANAAHVVIDFSKNQVLETLAAAKDTNTPIVIGTTGLTETELEYMTDVAQHIPIVYSPNMSIGANLIQILTEKVAGILDQDYDIDVFEIHHRGKIDSPSGTAKAIAEAAAKVRQSLIDTNATSPRPNNAVSISSIRGGATVCDHDVRFIGNEEMVTLSHRALSLNVFAKGALTAADWIKDKPAGLYSMKDVLGIN